MTGDPERERLDQLAARIREADQGHKADEQPSSPGAPAYNTGRIGFDFIATVLACIGVGWAADHFLGTGPWGILVMVIVGFVVGMYNVTRALNAKK